MRINPNMASLNIYRNQLVNEKQMALSVNNISTGTAINTAKDNPNSMALGEKMQMQIRGLQMASKNMQDGIGMLQTADGALDSVSNSVERIKELSVQAKGAAGPDERQILQNEINELVKGIDTTVKGNSFNGVNVLYDSTVTDNANPKLMHMTSGSNVGEKIDIPQYNLASNMLGGSGTGDKLTDIDVTSDAGAAKALDITDAALDNVSSARVKYGAICNRFESQYDNLTSISSSIEKASSDLLDTDIADEFNNYSKASLLEQAGTSLMVQTNKLPQDVLNILGNIRR